MRGLILLFKFMTRLPLGVQAEFDQDELGKGMKFFPVVGMVIGIILFGLFIVLTKTIVQTTFLKIVFLIIAGVVLTGGLHLDGLADTFDGIFSYRSKQKMLEIMKDSRLGTNGGLVLISYFLLKVALLCDLYSPVYQVVALLIAPAIARLNAVLNCAVAPYARPTGMGKTFVENTGLKELGIATVLTFIYCLGVFYCFSVPYYALLIIPVLMFLGYIFAKLMTRKIGGITGDTLGAVVEITEVLGIFSIYIFSQYYIF